MGNQDSGINSEPPRSKLFYGWVIVAVCTLIMAVVYGLIYSYSVFFKPLAEHFQWDRATVSGVYSASLIIRGAFSIGVGWLADKYGPVKITAICGFMIGLGLVLTSRVTELWQLYATYAVIEAVGLSGGFGIATAVTSRWFTKNRGLALGIVSSGVGVGTLLIVPGAERLINSFDWSGAYVIFGIVSGVVMIASAFLLKSPPANLQAEQKFGVQKPAGDVSLGKAIRSPQMALLILVFGCIFFCVQIIIVHLYNYATDIGINPLVAASLVVTIGILSIAGRMIMGVGSDRLGNFNILIICCILLIASFVCLIFAGSLWQLYIFAVIFGFAYGGEVPQIPLFLSKFFGTKAMAALMGVILFVSNIGGALGPLVAGKIYDLDNSYRWAFILGAVISLGALIVALILKKQGREVSGSSPISPSPELKPER
jgi:MFS family permease